MLQQLKPWALIGTFGLVGSLVMGRPSQSQPTAPSIRLITDPPIEQWRPVDMGNPHAQPPVSLQVQALDSTGKSLKNARLHLKLLTPPANPWFSTDFPIVEGTTLWDITTDTPDGQFQIQQRLPIRGTYQLEVTVTPSNSAIAPFSQTFPLTVAENSIKYRNLGILVVILLGVGFAGGWVIGGQTKPSPGEIAPTNVRLLLSGLTVVAIAALLTLNLSAEWAESHSHTHAGHDDRLTDSTAAKTNQLKISLKGTDHAFVGQLIPLTIQVKEATTGQPAKQVGLRLTTTQLEDQLPIYHFIAQTNSRGEFQWQQQFFDGAPHQIQVEAFDPATPHSPTILGTSTTEIEVSGISPPFISRLIALGYFTSVVVMGLGLGLWVQQRSPRPST